MKLKKLLAVFMAACLLITAVPVTAMAETTDDCSGNCDHVAAVGDVHFYTLQEAVEAASDGDTVRLLANLTLTEADRPTSANENVLIDVNNKKIILDLNKKIINVVHEDTFTNPGYIVAVIRIGNGAGLTVTGNGKIDVKANIDDPDIAYMFWKQGETGFLNIKNGIYHMNNSADSLVYTNGSGIVTVNGGTFTIDKIDTRSNNFPCIFSTQGQNERHIIVKGGTYNFDVNHQYWTNEVAVPKELALALQDKEETEKPKKRWTIVDAVAYVKEQEWSNKWYGREVGYATLEDAIETAEGVKIVSGKSGWDEEITLLKDCILSSDIDKEVIINGEGKTITVNDDITISQTIEVGGSLTLDATGHEITSDGDPFSAVEGVMTIIGGTFNFDPFSYLPEGCAVEEIEGGLYKIVPAEGSVAVIGSMGYASVEDAIEAAKQGDTIEVLKAEEKAEICDYVSADLSAGAELDLDEDTVTITGAPIVTVGDATVTVPEGESITVNLNSGKVTLPEAEGSEIVIDGKVISAGNGKVTITPEGEVKLPADSEIVMEDENGNKTEITVGEDGATITKDGEVELSEGSEIETGDVTISVGKDGATVTEDGKVELAEGGVITKEGNEPITVVVGKVTVDPAAGEVTAPAESKIEVGDKEITVGDGEATVDADGKVTVPTGSRIETEDKEITVGDGEAIITPEGEMELPEGSRIVMEDENGNETEITVGDSTDEDTEETATIKPNGDVIVPAGSQIETEDKEITVGDGDATIGADGQVTVPVGSTIKVEDKEITVGNGNATIDADGKVNLPADSVIKDGDKVTELEDGGIVNQDGTVSMPDTTVGGTDVYAPDGGNVTVNDDSSVTIPAGGKVVVNGETIEVVAGAVTVNPDGTVTIPEDSAIQKGDAVIEAGTGGLTVDNDGDVIVPENGTVEINGTTVTLPEGGIVDENGAITADKVVIGDATVTVPEGGSVTVDPEGTVTIPEGSEIEIGNETITVNKGEVTIDPDGNTVTVPEGGAVQIGDVTVNEGEITVEPESNDVTISEGSEIEANGKDITVGEGGATIESGESSSTVTLPEGSQIEIGEDTKITVGEGGTTITPEEDVTLPENSKIETGNDTEIIVGEGGATITPEGDVTFSEGSEFVIGDETITVNKGEVAFDPEEGNVIIPEGSTITQGNGTVIEAVKDGLIMNEDGTITVPEGGTVKVDGEVIEITYGGEIDENGTVKPNRKPDTSRPSNNRHNNKPNYASNGEKVETGTEDDAIGSISTTRTMVLTINQTVYQLDGQYMVNDVAPIIRGDRTFLPVRLIAENLGATVTWNEADQSVTIVKDSTMIVVYIDQVFALVNGNPVQLDASAFIVNGRTYLPVRFIAENLGAEVVWDGNAKTVTIIG